ncbi:MAG: desulfoferrodoxin [Phycisphaerales bacterium]|jgi:superoxide reductase|nr:desulfoferrodoxin [Phycisphaerales bacterium]MBT7171111.1 desulfoferrodoxin [Phycisphaerales bacterium]
MSYKRSEILGCQSCPVQVEVLRACDCTPSSIQCCGQPITTLDEKTADASTEKHVPVIEKVDGGYKVTVGSTLHPMADDHYIEWIELTVGSLVQRKYLTPGDEPVACFAVCCDCGATPTAREHCNKHGLWKA